MIPTMARFGNDQTNIGSLDVRKVGTSSRVEAFFVPTEPPPEKSTAQQRLAGGVKLIELDTEAGVLKIHPIYTIPTHIRYLRPKYEQVHTITVETSSLRQYLGAPDVEAILETLSPGFVKDFAYGLGLLKDCNRLIRLIEENTACDEIIFTDGNSSTVDGTTFRLGVERFSAIWTEITRINSRGNRASSRVKDVFVNNNLASTLGLPATEYSLGRHPDSRVIAMAADGVDKLSNIERDALVKVIASESAVIAESTPQKFQQLKRDIELVNLDRLIDVYSDSLNRDETEPYWQRFFDDNAFALQQVFGAPMVSVQSEARVGGRGLAGNGDKIADYLFKNSLTNNVALVEIKRPTTQIIDNREFRGGVFGPSTELNRAVTQVLDQAYSLTKNLTGLKESSRQWDLESYAISCFVVAGRTPSSSEPQRQKSFELYRANSRNVTIVTYDEILEHLQLLRNFFAPTTPSTKEI